MSENTAEKLILFYLWHGKHESFLRRASRILPLITERSRTKHFEKFYEALRRVPARDRQRLLAAVTVNQAWLEAVRLLRLQHQRRNVEITIISRNSIDLIKAWVLMNKAILEREHIVISTIIANRPILDDRKEIVTEHGSFRHVDHAKFGELQEEGKRAFLSKQVIYLGDAEEESLRSLVKQFVRV